MKKRAKDRTQLEKTLAEITASTIIFFFKLLETYFKLVFSLITSGAPGLMTLITLHLSLFLTFLTHL